MELVGEGEGGLGVRLGGRMLRRRGNEEEEEVEQVPLLYCHCKLCHFKTRQSSFSKKTVISVWRKKIGRNKWTDLQTTHRETYSHLESSEFFRCVLASL